MACDTCVTHVVNCPQIGSVSWFEAYAPLKNFPFLEKLKT